MGRAELERAVACAIADELDRGVLGRGVLEQTLAAAAIGVVLAEATRSIEARRDEIARVYDDGGAYAIGADDALAEALAALAALGELEPPPLV